MYMDVHWGVGASPDEVAQAHDLDLEVQEKYGVKYMRYWHNQEEQSVYCLVEAPNLASAMRVHREAHGLMPDELIEVTIEEVDRFLGARRNTHSGSDPADGGFRAIMFTDLEGSTELAQAVGDAAFHELLHEHDALIREQLALAGGDEIKHTGDGFLAAFTLASNAVECAIGIQKALATREASGAAHALRVRIGISAGEPVNDHQDIFGAAVMLAARVCTEADGFQILASRVIGDLCIGKQFEFKDMGDASLKGFSEPVRLLEVAWVAE